MCVGDTDGKAQRGDDEYFRHDVVQGASPANKSPVAHMCLKRGQKVFGDRLSLR